jgi:hypothetical protein
MEEIEAQRTNSVAQFVGLFHAIPTGTAHRDKRNARCNHRVGRLDLQSRAHAQIHNGGYRPDYRDGYRAPGAAAGA